MGFREVFGKKINDNKNQLKATPAWEQYIQNRAPEGTYYEKIGENEYQLVSNDGSYQLRVLTKLPDDLRHIPLKSSDDLTELLYRTQRQLDISSLHYIVNNEEVDEELIFQRFGEDEATQLLNAFIKPMKFPDPQEISIKLNNNEYSFMMERQPHPSLVESIFSSINNPIFKLTMVFKELTKTVDFDLKYDISNANSIEDILNNKQLLLDYTSGKVEALGQKFNEGKTKSKADMEDMIKFYEKLKEVSEKFPLEFNFKANIKFGDVEAIEKIYTSFILNEYYYNDETINSSYIDIDIEEEEVDSNAFQPGKKFALSGFRQVDLHALDQNITLFEQFVFPVVEYSHKEELDDSILRVFVNVLDDKIQYKKLFEESQNMDDFNLINQKLKTAIKINI